MATHNQADKNMGIHANVNTVPVEEFAEVKSHYLYVSHRILKTLEILKIGMTEYGMSGEAKRGKKTMTEVTFPIADVQDMQNLLEDLESRLRHMFVKDEAKSKRMKDIHAEKKAKEIRKGPLGKQARNLRMQYKGRANV